MIPILAVFLCFVLIRIFVQASRTNEDPKVTSKKLLAWLLVTVASAIAVWFIVNSTWIGL